MKKVCISVETLYNEFGENLTYGYIEKTYQEEDNTEYFDFINDKYGIACMDGEEVYIISDDNDYIEFLNNNGEMDTYFKLSKKEYEISVF